MSNHNSTQSNPLFPHSSAHYLTGWCAWFYWTRWQLVKLQSALGNHSINHWISHWSSTTVRDPSQACRHPQAPSSPRWSSVIIESGSSLLTWAITTQCNPIHSFLTHEPTVSLIDVLDSIELDDSYLDSNQLSGTIPSTIGSLTGLQKLYDNSCFVDDREW